MNRIERPPGTGRDARAEAAALLPAGHAARVLEPSPPANTDPAWMADDPTDRGQEDGVVVSPVSDGDVAWSTLAAGSPAIAEFARDHWLGPHPRLRPTTDAYHVARRGLHQVAFFAIAPRRFEATGKLGLRYTHGGFGTPFFGQDEQIRVDGSDLVLQQSGRLRSAPLTSVRQACEFLGITYRPEWFQDFHDPLDPVDPDRIWDFDARALEAIAAWFGFSTAVLEELRRTDRAERIGRVQLWPEHFDAAVELGDPDRGQRAGYGASPGDESHSQPYLYVAPWDDVDESDPFWNARSFRGALLPYQHLLDAEDQFGEALRFFRNGHRALTGLQ